MDSLNQRQWAFSHNEFASRINQTVVGLIERKLHAGLFFSAETIYYLTGYEAPSHYGFQLLVVPVDQEPFVVVRRHMLEDFQISSWLEIYVPFSDGVDGIEVARRSLADRNLASARLGFEQTTASVPLRTAHMLQQALPHAQFADCGGIVEALRVVKSRQEIEYMKHAARVADIGMEAARCAVRHGASERDIAAEVVYRTTLAGGEYSVIPCLIGIQERARLAMPLPTSRRLKAGEMCWIEIFGTVRRYTAGLKAVFGIEPNSQDLERRFSTALLALDRGIRCIAPGRQAADVADAIQKTFQEAGYADSSYHQSGYSIGIAMSPTPHEARLLSLRRGNSTLLKEGMTLHPIANLYGDGPHVGVSQSLVVTRTGSELLTEFQPSLADLSR